MAESSFAQIAVLALIQGLTEFLPVSSSGHLLLPSLLLGWPDQGLAFDVAFHSGTLIAVIGYFRHDLRRIVATGLRFGPGHAEGRMLWLLALATVPVGLAGWLLRDAVAIHARSLVVVAAASIGFGLLLSLADLSGRRDRGIADIGWKTALLIGLAQMFALIPGASRSGVTMTAALLLRLDRESAARFSFLLAIPVMLASGALEAVELLANPPPARQLLMLGFGMLLAAAVAWLTIDAFLRWIARVSFQPFVAYRVALGAALLLFLA
ncbi:MAG: undecaprenyl-diphosphate phosphatase [Gammaproteobacteria bacterium]|nr:undecaprenyl-diphosphate phosphatase [Gammaproteobacteria bacterium]